MSDLEVAVQPILFPAGGRDVLSVEDQAVVARWLAKTAVTLNTAQNYRLMVPRASRHALAKGLPTDFGVWLGTSQQDDGQLSFVQTTGAMGLARTDRLRQYQSASEQVYGCALRIGDLLGVVVYAKPGGWAKPTDPMARIWPNRRPIRWADLPTVEDPRVSFFLAGDHPKYSVTSDAIDRAIRVVESNG
jgi:hypothetical protein